MEQMQPQYPTQYNPSVDPSASCINNNYPLYGHSLSWDDPKQPKYGPNNTLCAKVWTPEVETNLNINSDCSYQDSLDTDFPTLWTAWPMGVVKK